MSAYVTNANWLMPFKEISTVHCERQTAVLIKLCGQNAEFSNPKVDTITYSRSPQQQLGGKGILNNKISIYTTI